MKVKAINILGTGAPYVEDVEEKLQAWLRDNPGVEIAHVVQTPVGSGYSVTSHLIVTIFYHD